MNVLFRSSLTKHHVKCTLITQYALFVGFSVMFTIFSTIILHHNCFSLHMYRSMRETLSLREAHPSFLQGSSMTTAGKNVCKRVERSDARYRQIETLNNRSCIYSTFIGYSIQILLLLLFNLNTRHYTIHIHTV